MISPRICILAATVLAFLGLSVALKIQSARLNSARAELSTAKASLLAERENTRKANEASNAYQADLKRLESERSNVPVVRLCKHRVPPTTTTPGPDAEATRHVGGEAAENLVAGPDIGTALLEYGIACEANMLQLDRLQQWVRNR